MTQNVSETCNHISTYQLDDIKKVKYQEQITTEWFGRIMNNRLEMDGSDNHGHTMGC